MRHGHHLEGVAFRIRPIDDKDADFVISLRRHDVRARFLNRISSSIERQLEWLGAYYLRQDDFYFVIEKMKDGSRQGLISLYDIDHATKQAEWGRWIVAPSSLAAVESVILIMDFAFHRLSLAGVYSKTAAGNQAVNSFHDGCGFRRAGPRPERVQIDEEMHDAVRHECSAEEWLRIRPRLEAKALRIAQRINAYD